MKKILTLALTACLAWIAASAQTAAFMGIPIDGSLNNFYRQMEAKGFELIESNEEGNIYGGTFIDEYVTATVMPGRDNQVAMVGAYFPLRNTWQGVLDDFNKYTKIYTGKYGAPDIEVREFNGLTPGSAAFLAELKKDNVEYRDIYIVDNVFITLAVQPPITYDEENGYQMFILYLNDDNFVDDEPDYSEQI